MILTLFGDTVGDCVGEAVVLVEGLAATDAAKSSNDRMEDGWFMCSELTTWQYNRTLVAENQIINSRHVV